MLFLRKFPPAVAIAKAVKFDIDCNLCLGFWVYTIMAGFLCVNILDVFYIPFASEIITGSVTSWVMHLLTIGWHTEYGVLEVK
jgi:hypothetical protein